MSVILNNNKKAFELIGKFLGEDFKIPGMPEVHRAKFLDIIAPME
jgi:hypothetical protein